MQRRGAQIKDGIGPLTTIALMLGADVPTQSESDQKISKKVLCYGDELERRRVGP